MQSKESSNGDAPVSLPKVTISTQVVAADSVQAQEVPTIPLDSLENISTLQPEVSVHAAASTHEVSMPVPLVVQPSKYQRNFLEWFQIWWEGTRPAYLTLSLMPVLLGTTLAWTQTVSHKHPFGHFHFTHFLFTCLAIVALQIGAHLVNDYYDYLRGIDTSNIFGPGELIQQSLVKPTTVLSLGLTLLGVGVLLGIVVSFAGGPWVYAIGLVGLLCAYFYSATSHSLGSLTLGELVSFCIYGPLITIGAYMVQLQTEHIETSVLLYSVPLGLFAAIIIHVNNMRDAEGDAQAGKRTIASILGLQWSRAFFIVLVLWIYTLVVVVGISSAAPHLILLTLWTLPLLLVAVSGVLRSQTPASLHLAMHQLLSLERLFTFLLVIALIVSAVVPMLPHVPTNLIPV
jgi:1,4-dihydroxy-2-naphthoate octaprenyltransferase